MSFRRFFAFFVFFLWATSALAQKPRDKAANKKIDEAINKHYLATNFDKAEGILIGTINACGDKCSAGVLARAWMYLGIVRGSGKNDVPGAQEAFAQATALDPAVKLDGELATAKTARAFESAGGKTTRPETPSQPATPAAPALTCTPESRSLKSGFPVPISCSSGEQATKADLSYRSAGNEWKTVAMKRRGDYFQYQLPCSATRAAGTVEVYVTVKDASGGIKGALGSETEPVAFTLSEASEEPVVAYPGKKAPNRCKDVAEDCPPDFPGCAGGKKEPKACEANADCNGGKCVDGACVAAESKSTYKKNWFGIHVAQDFAFLGGSDICSPDSQASNGFVCYFEGTSDRYTGVPQPGRGNNIVSGFTRATTRFMISYDRAFTQQFMLGARAGYAIGGGKAAANGTEFLPYHFEVRGTFFPLKNSLTKLGFRPYVHIGGGMAQVDAKLAVRAVDCTTLFGGAAAGPEEERACGQGRPSSNVQHPTFELDAYKKLGQGFVTFGGGAMYAVTSGFGLQFNLNALFMLPTSGAVLQPSAGMIFGL